MESFEFSRYEKSEEEKQIEALEELEMLLAEIIERGQELDAQVLQQLRSRVQDCLIVLGVKSLDELRLSGIMSKLSERKNTVPVPNNYPDKEDFKKRLTEISDEQDDDKMQFSGPVDPHFRDLVGDQQLLISICRAGKIKVKELQKRGHQSLEDYLYDLGKLMSDKITYNVIFEEDPIIVEKSGKVKNGRHRATTLKCLGEEYINESKMEHWVKSELEPEIKK